jgi:hypothetical protein
MVLGALRGGCDERNEQDADGAAFEGAFLAEIAPEDLEEIRAGQLAIMRDVAGYLDDPGTTIPFRTLTLGGPTIPFPQS